jgi:precorrin-2 dehydrogenase/sirohydrochlorin ferrochelatase
MRFYPVYLDLRGRTCAVVGGGRVAERKALSLFDAGAIVVVVSPLLTPSLQVLADTGKVRFRNKIFQEEDLRGVYLAIAATDDASANAFVAEACRKAGILVNVVTDPSAGTFIVPSVVERGDLLIAVSTCGDSPALARRVREDLEQTYGPEYGVFLEKMALLRRKLLAQVTDEGMRRKVFQAIVDSDVLYLLKAGEGHEADRRIEEIVKAVAK